METTKLTAVKSAPQGMKPGAFMLQNLLRRDRDGKVSGPMSPVLFAQEMARKQEMTFNRLVRVSFHDGEINNIYEDGYKRGLTGHDTLVIGRKWENEFMLQMWTDEGCNGIMIAGAFQSDGEIIMTPIYGKRQYEKKLSPENVKEIFEAIWDNPAKFEIRDCNE